MLTLVVLLGACAAGPEPDDSALQRKPSGSQSSKTEPEDDTVCAALINGMYVHDAANGDVVVEDQTSLGESVSNVVWTTDYVRKNMPKTVAKSVFDDFLAKNHDPQSLPRRIGPGAGYSIITKSEADELRKTGGLWDAFSKKYPNGIFVTISRVGFNEEMNQALVCASHTCGWKCGMGYYVLLTKESNVWGIKHKVNVWAS